MWLIHRGRSDTVTPVGDRTNLIWLWCYIPEEYHGHQDEGQQPNGDVEECEQVRMCDVIRITGKQEKCEAAKRALLDLVPVTVEVGSSLELLFRSWQLLTWLIIYCLSWEMKVPLEEFTTGHLSYAKWISPHLHTVYVSCMLILLSLPLSYGWSLPLWFLAKVLCALLILLKGAMCPIHFTLFNSVAWSAQIMQFSWCSFSCYPAFLSLVCLVFCRTVFSQNALFVAIGSRSFNRCHFILDCAGCMLHLLHLISSIVIIVSFMQVRSLILILVIKTCFNFLAFFPVGKTVFSSPKCPDPSLYLVGSRGSSPGVKLQGCEADHSPASSARVKNEWSYLCLHAPKCLHEMNSDSFIFWLYLSLW